MLFLAMLNVVTSGFPLAIFPVGGMMIQVLTTASRIFLSNDEAHDRSKRASRSGDAARVMSSAESTTRLSKAQAYKRQIDARPMPLTIRFASIAAGAVNKVAAWIREVEAMSRQMRISITI
jgi:hypothetical protein